QLNSVATSISAFSAPTLQQSSRTQMCTFCFAVWKQSCKTLSGNEIACSVAMSASYQGTPPTHNPKGVLVCMALPLHSVDGVGVVGAPASRWHGIKTRKSLASQQRCSHSLSLIHKFGERPLRFGQKSTGSMLLTGIECS